MSFDPGSVSIRFRCDPDGKVTEGTVVSKRPRVSAALVGKPINQVLALVPLVYSVCGRAQSAAARTAVDAANGRSLGPNNDKEIAAEAAREHLMHLLAGGDRNLLARVLRGTRYPGDEARTIATEMLGMPWDVWLDAGDETVADWMEAPSPFAAACRRVSVEVSGCWHSRPLPSISAAESLSRWPRLDAGFAAAPTYLGEAAETGAWARAQGAGRQGSERYPFRNRWLARMREWLIWCSDSHGSALGRISGETVAAGVGRSAVETARGLLLQEISVAEGIVTDYVIVAPTEWNFHPRGVLAEWLRQGAGSTHVETAIEALDPCVPIKMIRDE